MEDLLQFLLLALHICFLFNNSFFFLVRFYIFGKDNSFSFVYSYTFNELNCFV